MQATDASVPGCYHSDTLTSVHNLGMLLNGQGKVNLAEHFVCRALEGYERTLGRDHIATLTVANNLGMLLRDQGKLDLAESVRSARKKKIT